RVAPAPNRLQTAPATVRPVNHGTVGACLQAIASAGTASERIACRQAPTAALFRRGAGVMHCRSLPAGDWVGGLGVGKNRLQAGSYSRFVSPWSLGHAL